MTAVDEDPTLDRELDEVTSNSQGNSKGLAVPLKRTRKQRAALEKAAARQELRASAARLAQIVNLHIAGFSLADIGAQIGASADEVDRMLAQDAARYVRSQPALRVYVRNWISERYLKMIEADWDQATTTDHVEKLEHQDRVMRMLDRMAKLHGADAPTQAEVTVDAAPDAVEKLVAALAASHGQGYDDSVFDIPESDIHEAVVVSGDRTVVSGNRVGVPDEDTNEGEGL